MAGKLYPVGRPGVPSPLYGLARKASKKDLAVIFGAGDDPTTRRRWFRSGTTTAPAASVPRRCSDASRLPRTRWGG